MSRIPRGKYLGKDVGSNPTDEEHFMVCPACGVRFDMRDLAQALDHLHDGPEIDLQTKDRSRRGGGIRRFRG